MQLKPTFIQKEIPALVFSRQISKIFNNNFFKDRKKKNFYKKKSIVMRKKKIVIRNVDQLSITNLITQLFM